MSTAAPAGPPISLIFPLVWWSIVAVGSGWVAAVYLLRYTKQP